MNGVGGDINGILLGGLMAIVAVGILLLNDRLKRRRVVTAWKKGRRPLRGDLNHRLGWGLTIFIIIYLLAMSKLNPFNGDVNRQPAPLPAQLPADGNGGSGGLRMLGRVAGILFFSLMLCVIAMNLWVRYFLIRPRDPRFRQIETLALDGNVSAAIDLLHRIQGGDTANSTNLVILNYMSALEGLRGNWAEALRLVERLESLSPSHSNLSGVKGMALWKTGQLGAAEDSLRSRLCTEMEPDASFRRIAMGLFLVDVGRFDEAALILKTLDVKLAQTLPFTRCRSQEVLVEHLRKLIHADRNQTAMDLVCIEDPEFEQGFRHLIMSNVIPVVTGEEKPPLFIVRNVTSDGMNPTQIE